MSLGADEMFETMKGLYEAGAITKTQMNEFAALYRQVPKYDAAMVKELRAKTSFSQAAFARLLNVSPSSVRQWESGAKKPDGASRKLLQLLEAHGDAAFLV